METITDELREWIGRQPVFFVATAPLEADGLLNCSPKGGDTFRVLGPQTVAYLDLTGSGIETAAHLRQNGRIVLMFCAFAGDAQILRLYGRGEVLSAGHPEYAALAAHFPDNPGARGVIRVQVSRVAISCGMAVPFLDFRAPRGELDAWAAEKGPAGLQAYRQRKNRQSLDGLPGLDQR